MFYKKFVYTFLAMLIAVAFFNSLTMPANAAFDPQDPKAWAIANYQVKKAMPKYAPKSDLSVKRNKNVDTTLNSLMMLSHTASDERYTGKLTKLGQSQVKSIDAANKALDDSTSRKGAKKFFVGPDYKTLKIVKDAVSTNESIIKDYQTVNSQINSIPARIVLNQSIKSLQTHDNDLKSQLKSAESGFSLLGWLIRPLKYK